jgi:hypothetical protein
MARKASNQLIDTTAATRNPFRTKYSNVEYANWESCSMVDPLPSANCSSWVGNPY